MGFIGEIFKLDCAAFWEKLNDEWTDSMALLRLSQTMNGR